MKCKCEEYSHVKQCELTNSRRISGLAPIKGMKKVEPIITEFKVVIVNNGNISKETIAKIWLYITVIFW